MVLKGIVPQSGKRIMQVFGNFCQKRKRFAILTFCRYNYDVKFTWDEVKRQINLKRHGFDFKDGAIVFAGEVVTVEDTRYEYGEERFATLGMFYGRVVMIIHTERGNMIRMISMRKATKYEERTYFEQLSY